MNRKQAWCSKAKRLAKVIKQGKDNNYNVVQGNKFQNDFGSLRAMTNPVAFRSCKTKVKEDISNCIPTYTVSATVE